MAQVGVEGTGAYGAGLARHLRGCGVEVIEVDRPNRQLRRRSGKTDSIDAIEAEIEAAGLARELPDTDGCLPNDPPARCFTHPRQRMAS